MQYGFQENFDSLSSQIQQISDSQKALKSSISSKQSSFDEGTKLLLQTGNAESTEL